MVQKALGGGSRRVHRTPERRPGSGARQSRRRAAAAGPWCPSQNPSTPRGPRPANFTPAAELHPQAVANHDVVDVRGDGAAGPTLIGRTEEDLPAGVQATVHVVLLPCRRRCSPRTPSSSLRTGSTPLPPREYTPGAHPWALVRGHCWWRFPFGGSCGGRLGGCARLANSIHERTGRGAATGTRQRGRGVSRAYLSPEHLGARCRSVSAPVLHPAPTPRALGFGRRGPAT